jgi:hypothetical protein
MRRRQISETEVALVLKSPQQVKTVRESRKIYQSIFETEEPTKDYLIRVVVDIDRSPPEVVTVYRTSKIDKYWSSGS